MFFLSKHGNNVTAIVPFSFFSISRPSFFLAITFAGVERDDTPPTKVCVTDWFRGVKKTTCYEHLWEPKGVDPATFQNRCTTYDQMALFTLLQEIFCCSATIHTAWTLWLKTMEDENAVAAMVDENGTIRFWLRDTFMPTLPEKKAGVLNQLDLARNDPLGVVCEAFGFAMLQGGVGPS